MRTKEEINRLVEENTKLVYVVLNTRFKRFIPVAMKLDLYDDIYQEGCIGLYKAAKVFDEDRGCKFSTIASICIGGEISKFISRYFKKHYRADLISLENNINIDGEREICLKDLIKDEENQYEDLEIKESISKIENYLNEEEKAILKLRMNGYSQVNIGEILGTSQVYVSRRIKEIKNIMNLVQNNMHVDVEQRRSRRSGGTTKKKNLEIQKSVIALRKQGLSYRAISSELGVPTGSIGAYLRAM